MSTGAEYILKSPNVEPANHLLNDNQKPDYKITWFDSSSSRLRECVIFSYGKGEALAVAIFKFLYPGNHSFDVIKINQN